ncbi:MAG: phosphate/phosphite/phosphonate ABC transporter substrate-binding protein [Pleurocapsa sp.]
MTNNKPITFIILIFTLLGLGACRAKNIASSSETLPATNPPIPQKAIVLGDISDNPRKKIRKFQPLADYLAVHLSRVDRGEVKIAPDMETMIAWLKSGEVDIYIDSPYPAMLAINGANAKPILRRWKKGSAEYYSLIITMSDHNINSLSDLQGKTIAFDHPFSTTGYMLPLAELLKSGLKAVEVKSSTDPVSKDAVSYGFSNEDENSIEWLLSGKVAAAAIDNQIFDKFSPEIKEKVVILAKTEPIARNLVLVRGDLAPEQINAISSILLDMDRTPGGRAVLEQFNQTTKFDQFPTEESLNRIQNLYQQAQNQ